ncbi:MAG: hypothetical protein WCO84_05070 [bacterium]
MSKEKYPTQPLKNIKQPESSHNELENFRNELKPIFNERFITYGHGTQPEFAENILKEGLYAKQDNILTTAIGLDNTEEGLREILNWKHLGAKAIIVLMFPAGKITNEKQIWEENKNISSSYDNSYFIPTKFIKGYIDVDSKKLILNDKFEENPIIKEFKPLTQDSLSTNKKREKIEIVTLDDSDSGVVVF